MNKWVEKIYDEKDIVTNISVFISVIIAIIIYKTVNNAYLSFLSLIGFFSLTKIISKITITVISEKINKKKFLDTFSTIEKNAIFLFVSRGTVFLLFSDIDTDEFGDGLRSLESRGFASLRDQTEDNIPIAIVLSEDIYNKFLNL